MEAKGSLVCYVGWAHAKLTDYDSADIGSTAGRIAEGNYFNTEFPATRGRVASILIERVEPTDQSPLEAAAIALMGDRDRVFINLRDKSWSAIKNRPAAFFSLKEPKFDGVLFIK